MMVAPEKVKTSAIGQRRREAFESEDGLEASSKDTRVHGGSLIS